MSIAQRIKSSKTHLIPIELLIKDLKVDPMNGLTNTAANDLNDRYGDNEIT